MDYQLATSSTEAVHLVSGSATGDSSMVIEATKETEFRFTDDPKPVCGYYAKLFLFNEPAISLSGIEAKKIFEIISKKLKENK